MKYIAAALAFASSLFAGQVSAQNVVANGGFEDGVLAPWSSSTWGVAGLARTDAFGAGTGCVGAVCLNPNVGSLAQDLPTTIGTTYTLTFWYRMDSLDPPTELQALISDGAPTSGGAGTCTGSCVFQTATPVTTWTQGSHTFVATSTTTRLTFLGRNDPAGVYLDDVSVAEAGASVATIPTMSEWARILLGLTLAGGAALYIQRRRSLI